MSLMQKIYQQAFGTKSKTETAAEALDTAINSNDSFLDRAIAIFNRRQELEEAKVEDHGKLEERSEGSVLWVMLGAVGLIALGAVGVAAAGMGGLGAMGMLMGVGAAAAMVGGFGRAYTVYDSFEKVSAKLDQRYTVGANQARAAIEDMEKSLDKQTPEVRQQFNEAFTRATQVMQTFEAKRAAEAAQQEAEAANTTSTVAAVAAATVIVSSVRR